MRRLILILISSWVLTAGSAAAQSLLPSSFAGWNASGESTVIPSKGLDEFLSSDAAVFREYVVKSVERRDYAQGQRSATITSYRMRDPSSAYGAYTFLRDNSLTPPVYRTNLGSYTFVRDDALTPVDMGSFGSASPVRALIVIGNFVLDVTSKDSRPADADLKLLVGSLDKQADHSPYPYIGAYLPDQGHVRRSEHYVLGPRTLARFVPLGTDDWVGFDHSAEAITATYHLAGTDATLLIASYPTQQIAADKFDGMLRRFTFDPPGGVTPGQTALFGKRSSSIVAVVIGAPSREAANILLDRIRYESQVTWNEPKHTLTDPSISSIVIGAFLGTGAIMVLTLMVGIGFGGIRVLLKIFLPNKVFDREKEIEILQLGIYSKPIHAKDFYQRTP